MTAAEVVPDGRNSARGVIAGDGPALWSGSGGRWLTGRPGGPRPTDGWGVAVACADLASAVEAATGAWGRRVVVDGPALVGERAALSRLSPRGPVSVGGGASMVEAADGWVALNLPRSEDVAALPALVAASVDPADWTAVRRRLACLTRRELVERAALLGLAVGAVPDPVGRGDGGRDVPGDGSPPWRLVTPVRPGWTRDGPPLVVDLTGLWAGPLAGGLLAEAGAVVVKVEGRRRPDGARRGPAAFFDLLNGWKLAVTVDPDEPADRALLGRLVAAADLVLDSSRARSWPAWGFEPAEVVSSHATAWVSITAHGRGERADDLVALRVGFGDDAAAEAGLVDRTSGARAGDGVPGFVADAVADPLAGLAAAASGAGLLARGEAALVEVTLAGVARWARRRGEVRDGGVPGGEHADEVAPPRARPVRGRAPVPGAADRLVREALAPRGRGGPDAYRSRLIRWARPLAGEPGGGGSVVGS